MKRILRLLALFLAAVFLNIAAGEGESFLVISDAHLTKETQEHEAMMEAVIRAAREKDAVLLLGDNTNNTHPGAGRPAADCCGAAAGLSGLGGRRGTGGRRLPVEDGAAL